MKQNLIVRIYDSKERAGAAATKLHEAGFGEEAVLALAPGSAKSVANALLAGQLMGHHAQFYAERVRRGRTLVAVDAPFGQGRRATEIMDSCSPVDLELKLPEDPSAAEWNEGTPFSAALGIPVLWRDEPAPLSTALQVPTLTRCRYFLTSRLASSSFALSELFGLRLLSRNATPLSSALGLGTLSRNPAPLSSAFGLKLLSRLAAPLSAAFNLPTISRNPTPLSSAFGLPVLSSR